MTFPRVKRTFEEQREAFERAQLAFGAPPPRKPSARLKPKSVRMLRALGSKLLDYPVEGTEEWTRFEEDYKASVAARLQSIPKREIPRFAPGAPERAPADSEAVP